MAKPSRPQKRFAGASAARDAYQTLPATAPRSFRDIEQNAIYMAALDWQLLTSDEASGFSTAVFREWNTLARRRKIGLRLTMRTATEFQLVEIEPGAASRLLTSLSRADLTGEPTRHNWFEWFFLHLSVIAAQPISEQRFRAFSKAEWERRGRHQLAGKALQHRAARRDNEIALQENQATEHLRTVDRSRRALDSLVRRDASLPQNDMLRILRSRKPHD